MTLKRRIMALETTRPGRSRFIVTVGSATLDATAELHNRGVVVATADTLVTIRKPVAAMVSITVDGRPC